MDEQQNFETPSPEADVPFTVTDAVEGQEVFFGPGFAGSVSAKENVNVSKGGALAITAGHDASVVYGGALAIPVGHDLNLVNGGALIMPVGGNAQVVNGGAETLIVGGNLDIANGGSLLSFSSQVNAKNSFFGIIISGGTTLQEGSRVLLDNRQAALFGAAFGAAFALLSLLFRRRK
ncbi:MAG: hypothetical protein EHM21_08875 [Chloroflexi bacterium]|nr:MAG: hypothetical protein EHM21_08875 [Chloroflexota bacterium]